MGGPCRRNPRVTRPSPRASRNGDRHGCQAHQGDSGRAEIGRRAGSDAPGPDRDCCCPSLTSAASRHPSSASKHLVRPWSGHAVLPPNPRSHHQRQGAPESRWAPRSPCRSLSPASLCSSEQGQDWPGVALSQGLTLLSRHLPPAAPRQGQLVSEPVVPHHTSLTQRQKTAAMALPVTGDSRIVRSGLSYIIVTASGFQVLLLTPALNTY